MMPSKLLQTEDILVRIRTFFLHNSKLTLTSEEIVKLLLADPRVDPSADSNYAIRFACESGHLEIGQQLCFFVK